MKLSATYDLEAYQFANIIIVVINLNIKEESYEKGGLMNCYLSGNGCKAEIPSITGNCWDGVSILVETTTPPRIYDRVLKSIIEEVAKRDLTLENYRFGLSCKRIVLKPQYIDAVREVPRACGGVATTSENVVEEFSKSTIDISEFEVARFGHTSGTEMAKVLITSYRAMDI